MSSLFRHANQDIRTLLITLGVDEYNSQALITTMFISPAATDLDMPAVILTIKALQRALARMGASDVYPTGKLDLQTASAIAQITGPGWKAAPWYMTVQAVVYAASHGRTVSPARPAAPGMPVSMSGSLMSVSLPAVPGGILGWVAIAAGAYYVLHHHKR